MELNSLLKHVDHTLLDVSATESDYNKLCDDGVEYGVASVCVPPSRVKMCAERVGDKLPVCSVIGFPNGYHDSDVKAYEASLAIEHGASEIDMVIDVGKAKEHKYDDVLSDIQKVREATKGYILKVIIETALLDTEEKIALCDVVNKSGADFIKTSTGFAGGGATFDDVTLLRKHASPSVKVKASGGIATLDDAHRFIELGADRLGTSRIVKIVKGMSEQGDY